ncbi:MAG: ABC transporter permease [Oscillospiraceae bacterium]|jgi:multidrug/hemolysin transport system permease protein|nr:ABC transporter permease [Oscillospiraceae bacterium]
MIFLAKRNLKIFFRDRMHVFFSLLGVLIIIALYLLFLGDVMRQSLPEFPGVRFLMDSWIMAGTLAVATLTTTLGAFGVMVDDHVRGVRRDFLTSPLRRRSLAGGYWLGAVGIGGMLCLITLALAEGYILLGGGKLLSPRTLLALLGVLALGVLSSGAMAFFVVSFFRSQNAFGAASTIVGSMTGFLTGVYLPVGQLPGPVQWVVKLFPVSHVSLLLRRLMMETPMAETFRDAPDKVVRDFREELGLTYFFGGHAFPAWASAAVLVGTAALFFALGFWNVSRKQKE